MNHDFNPYAAPSIDRAEPTKCPSEPAFVSDELRRIASGLDFIRAALVLFLVDVLALIAWIVILWLGEGPRDIQPLIFLGFETALVGAHCLWLFGTSRCLVSPLSARAHPLVATTVVAQTLSLILTIGSFLNVRTIGGPRTQEVVAAVACVTFILFLRELAKYLGRPDLAGRAAMLVIVWGALLVTLATVLILSLIIANVARHPHRPRIDLDAYAAAGMTMVLLAIGAVLAYLKLLAGIKSALLEPSDQNGGRACQ